MEKISPKKSLGQNFLIDKNISKKIADSLECKSNDIIIEIGCGTGALTEQLLSRKPKFLYSVDIDKRAIEAVNTLLSATEYKNYKIIHSDIRDIKIDELTETKDTSQLNVKVIGNIPYNISGDILFWIFEQRKIITKAIIMVQKEVAQRLTSKAGTKSYGITTVAMNLTSECKALFDVSPKCFYPVPKVTSTVIEITPLQNLFPEIDFDELMKLIKSAFNQRRKVLRNALSNYIQKYGIIIDDLDDSKSKYISDILLLRAEKLTAEEYVKLYNFLQERRNF